MKSILLFVCLLLLLTSCKKEADVSASSPGTIDSSQIFPNYVRSDSRHEYYIEGIFNGKKICLSPTVAPSDTFSNVYYFDTLTRQDQLNLIRTNDEGSAQMQIYMGESKMLRRSIPYSLPHSNLALCEFTQFQFYDTWHRQGNENSEYDYWTYQASTNTGMKLTVTSFADGVIEGTFEGTLRTNTGRIMKVKEGAFRIKIYLPPSALSLK